MEGRILMHGKPNLQQELGEMGQKSKQVQKGLYRWKENRSTSGCKTPVQIQLKLPWRKHWSTGSLLLLIILTSIHKHFVAAKLKELELRPVQPLPTAAFSRVYVILLHPHLKTGHFMDARNIPMTTAPGKCLHQFKVVFVFQFTLEFPFLLHYCLLYLIVLEGGKQNQKPRPSSIGKGFWWQH